MQDLQREIEAAFRIESLPKILDAACSLVGMRRATFARVTETRWVACGIRDGDVIEICNGLELDVTSLICDDVRKSGKAVVVNSIADDEVYRDHPAAAAHNFKSVISVPVHFRNGEFFGTLSALGDEPRDLDNADTLRSFELFADLISVNLDRELQLETSRQALAEERRLGQLREQFVAVLGHDLKNPLASIKTSAFVLRRRPGCEDLSDLIEQSVARMSGLIDDVLDFARGRLGEGIPVRLGEPASLSETAHETVREVQAAHPERILDVSMDLDQPVVFDRSRFSQLLCNLLSNAVSHGAHDESVRVRGAIRDGVVEISVANGGRPIPVQAMGMLFQPFVRASAVEDGEGLGLGLFIASEIARGHSGSIDVSSGPAETRFTFRMPVEPPAGAVRTIMIDGPVVSRHAVASSAAGRRLQ